MVIPTSPCITQNLLMASFLGAWFFFWHEKVTSLAMNSLLFQYLSAYFIIDFLMCILGMYSAHGNLYFVALNKSLMHHLCAHIYIALILVLILIF